jgi:hypothetical protein
MSSTKSPIAKKSRDEILRAKLAKELCNLGDHNDTSRLDTFVADLEVPRVDRNKETKYETSKSVKKTLNSLTSKYEASRPEFGFASVRRFSSKSEQFTADGRHRLEFHGCNTRTQFNEQEDTPRTYNLLDDSDDE